MKRIDILYGLELIMFNYKRKSFDYDLIEKLMDKNYADWYSWFDKKEDRHLHKINATQKGLTYYANYKRRGRYKWRSIFGIFVLLIPIAFMLIKGGVI